MDFLKPMDTEIINAINPQAKDIILDIAAGTGEPGLTIAAILDGGKVVIRDLSDEMLAIAEENAVKKNITNIETKPAMFVIFHLKITASTQTVVVLELCFFPKCNWQPMKCYGY